MRLHDKNNQKPERLGEFPDLQARTWGGKGEKALLGDAGVDIPMFKACGLGVAMGNGSPEIRAAADHVTCDVEADGLWNAFSFLELI